MYIGSKQNVKTGIIYKYVNEHGTFSPVIVSLWRPCKISIQYCFWAQIFICYPINKLLLQILRQIPRRRSLYEGGTMFGQIGSYFSESICDGVRPKTIPVCPLTRPTLFLCRPCTFYCLPENKKIFMLTDPNIFSENWRKKLKMSKLQK